MGAVTQKLIARLPCEPPENELWEMSSSDLKALFLNKNSQMYEVIGILESICLVYFAN